MGKIGTWASSKLIGWSNSSHEVETDKKKQHHTQNPYKYNPKKTAMQTSPNDSRAGLLTRSPDVWTLWCLKILFWVFSGSNHLQVCGVEEFNCKGHVEILWSSLRFHFCLSAWITVVSDIETLIWSLLNFHIWNASSGIDQLLLFLQCHQYVLLLMHWKNKLYFISHFPTLELSSISSIEVYVSERYHFFRI